MLVLARRSGECIMIGDQIEVSVVEIRGEQVKLGIKAPRSVGVYRSEVFEAIQQENRRAAEQVDGSRLGTIMRASGFSGAGGGATARRSGVRALQDDSEHNDSIGEGNDAVSPPDDPPGT